MAQNIAHLDLFLDESGSFNEGDTVFQDDTTRKKIPSQLAGILAPQNSFNKKSAQKVLSTVLRTHELPIEREFHSTEIKDNHLFNNLVQACLQQIKNRDWQPVRIVNTEGVSFGNQVATYCNMVAELVVRIFEEIIRKGYSEIHFDITCASVTREDEQGNLVRQEKENYLSRLKEYIAQVSLRRGFSKGFNALKVDRFQLGSGTRWRTLQICDLLSNSSHTTYNRCEPETRTQLKDAFGIYNYTLCIYEIIKRLNDLISNDFYGMTLQLIGQTLTGSEPLHTTLKEKIAAIQETTIQRMAIIDESSRKNHLQILISWLEQIVYEQRDTVLADKIVTWIRENPLKYLEQLLPDNKLVTLKWFKLSILSLGLTTLNHKGDVDRARKVCADIDKLIPQMAGQWDNVPVIIQTLLHQGVHLIDCFEPEVTARKMAAVTKYYQELSLFFNDLLPEIFQEKIRSNICGRALGTQLQAEMYMGLDGPAHFNIARELSDKAIDEFDSHNDKCRQYQYRCQLETYMGNFDTALTFLCKSLDVEDDISHDRIAATVASLGFNAQGFLLLHWLRLGAAICGSGSIEQKEKFLQAFESSALTISSWEKKPETPQYPAYGIIRQAALIYARSVNEKKQKKAFTLLKYFSTDAKSADSLFIFSTIQLASYAEIASVMWDHKKYRKNAVMLFSNKQPDQPGIIQLHKKLRQQVPDDFIGFHAQLNEWGTSIETIKKLGKKDKNFGKTKGLLGKIARVVPY